MPLRLKSLELHGYKTFAARTVFEFASGITAIVGPNGAGKSNIADALRWVLGEQSYSLLRGKKTEDMIFSGSEHRPRAGMASAEIVFDNTTNWLPVDFAEVAMTRRAYRDGHNEYLLNGQHVRLRDMNELLASAGLSERTYTIVGQGLVDASLALKADERRRLFEEAAGVGLHRVRREEALRRLEATQHNLERVQDILAEIEPRLKTLERQARRANEYAAAQSELRELLREWYGYHWHRAQKELQDAQEIVRGLQNEAMAARAESEASQTEYGKYREQLAQLRSQLSAWRREVADLSKEREALDLALAVLDERRRSTLARREAQLAEHQAALNEEQVTRQRLADLERELARAEGDATEAGSQLAAAQATLKERQQGRGSLEGELLAAQDKVADFSTQRAQTQARLDAAAAQVAYHDERLQVSLQDIEALEKEIGAVGLKAEQAAAARKSAQKEVALKLEHFETAKRELQVVERRRQESEEERLGLLSSQAKLKAHLEVLEQAEQSLSGYADGARFLLDAARQSKLKAHGALSALLNLPAELETPVAAALGDAVDTVLLDESEVERALALLESEDAGRAVLLAVDGHSSSTIEPPNDPDVLGVASRMVHAPPGLQVAVDVLLGSTLLVRSREAARRLLHTLPSHSRIVTLGGDVFRGDGLISAGKTGSSSTLSRPRQQRDLKISLEDADQRLSRLDSIIEEIGQQIQEASRAVAGRESDVLSAQTALRDAEATQQNADLDVQKQQRLLDWQRSRHADLQRGRAEAEAERQRLAALAAGFGSSAEMALNEVRRLSLELGQLSLEEVQQQVAYWSTRAAVTEQAANATRTRTAEQEVSLQRVATQVQDLQEKSAQTSSQLAEMDEENKAQLARERTLRERLDALQARIAPIEQQLDQAEQGESMLEQSETAAQRNASSAERALSQAEIEFVRRQEALESLRARIVDDFGLVSFEYAAGVEGPVPLPFEGLVEQLPNVRDLNPGLEEQLAQGRTRLRRLGLINPEAAAEYNTESERYSFMSTQVQDLHQAEADLRQVIAELDELTRQEFSRTYLAVDKEFRAIFTRLFGGGSAHLSLTDPDNLVETGIEIDARLPGRREQGLSLLSGGERSLTAIALVFALLKVSPTPVCVMDEVDAMLDEANVGRFRDLLRELSQDTQFIIITHNRNTVQAADFIYGVTMGRDSTSQIISLRLDEVSEEMLGTSRI